MEPVSILIVRATNCFIYIASVKSYDEELCFCVQSPSIVCLLGVIEEKLEKYMITYDLDISYVSEVMNNINWGYNIFENCPTSKYLH